MPNKPTFKPCVERIDALAEKSYEELSATHRADHQEFYKRVDVDLGGEPSTTIPTDQQMAAYRAGGQNIHLEETPTAETVTLPRLVTIAVSTSCAHETRSCCIAIGRASLAIFLKKFLP